MPWVALAGVRTGDGHVASQMPCQDAAAVRVVNDRLVVAALADGMGTAPHSDEGAARAVELSINMLADWCGQVDECPLPQDVHPMFERVVESVQRQASAIAAARAIQVDALKSTLIVVACTPTWVIAMSVGDGFVVARFAGSVEYRTILTPSKGEYDNETDSVLGSVAIERMRVFVENRPLASLAASSDGLLDVALRYHTWEPSQRLFQVIETKVGAADSSDQRVIEFLNLPMLNTPELHDDKSLVCIRSLETAAEILPQVDPSRTATPLDITA